MLALPINVDQSTSEQGIKGLCYIAALHLCEKVAADESSRHPLRVRIHSLVTGVGGAQWFNEAVTRVNRSDLML